MQYNVVIDNIRHWERVQIPHNKTLCTLFIYHHEQIMIETYSIKCYLFIKNGSYKTT